MLLSQLVMLGLDLLLGLDRVQRVYHLGVLLLEAPDLQQEAVPVLVEVILLLLDLLELLLGPLALR